VYIADIGKGLSAEGVPLCRVVPHDPHTHGFRQPSLMIPVDELQVVVDPLPTALCEATNQPLCKHLHLLGYYGHLTFGSSVIYSMLPRQMAGRLRTYIIAAEGECSSLFFFSCP
jgi:hypothetical protein